MKDTFIQLTAHELRTPLTLVYGYSRLIEDNAELKALVKYDTNLRMLMEGMSGAIVRMQAIVNEILLVSRIMTNRIDLSIGPTDLGDIVRKVITATRRRFRSARSRCISTKRNGPNGCAPTGNCSNWRCATCSATPSSSRPTAGRSRSKRRSRAIKVRFSIKDTGIGIAPETQTTLFERFHTNNDVQLHSTSKTAFRGGGIGLGLAVCKGIIEAHGGEITCHSDGYDPQKLPGSEFIVVLPLFTERQASGQAMKLVRPSPYAMGVAAAISDAADARRRADLRQAGDCGWALTRSRSPPCAP